MTIIINNLHELDMYFAGVGNDTANCNLVNYVWIEYGFYPIYFNELFKEFFDTVKGKIIGVCFEGHELFYEDLVDELLILKGFINTSKAYRDNRETPLLLENFKRIPDKGIAFWNTLRNFNEDEYDTVIAKYQFKNIIHPIGRDVAWRNGLFAMNRYKYATGERDYWTAVENTLWKITGTLGWDIRYWKQDYQFPDVLEIGGNYDTLFIKNTWKTRKYNTNIITDYLVGNDGMSGVKGLGQLDIGLYDKIIEYYTSGNANRKLVVINDLVRYPLPKHVNIIEINMIGFLDVRKLCSIIHNSRVFITPATSPLDLAAYYCNTNLVLFDDYQNKIYWTQYVLDFKRKRAIAIENNSNEFDKFKDFVEKQ